MKRILLVTPDPTPDKKAEYGGGHGGYVRMSNVLLKTFKSEDFEIVPCYHSVRRSSRLAYLKLPFRLINDVGKVAAMARHGDGIHMTLQYRLAITREFGIAFVARRLGCPLLVDIRAGAFESWYKSASAFAKRLTRYILESAKEISVEGVDYISFIETEFGRKATYFPNFVPSYEIPDQVPPKCRGTTLKLLFVGYAYDGKGIAELVEGCEQAAGEGIRLRLSIAGRESDEIASWLTARPDVAGLEIRRLGPQDHDRIIELFHESDVFCLPTRHPGEGHSNSINEAMMMGMVIVTTRHGFIPSVIDESACYFVEKKSAGSIAETLKIIDGNRDDARTRASKARAILRDRYSSDVVTPVLELIYRRLVTFN